ncbi:MAG TPA: hypothetical protein ENK53_03540 [Thiotrichales bacterium]|nr:hypothetical protein [Thiotrichales bacterium]
MDQIHGSPQSKEERNRLRQGMAVVKRGVGNGDHAERITVKRYHGLSFHFCCSIMARITQAMPPRNSLRRNTISSILDALSISGSTSSSSAICGIRRAASAL